MPQFAYQALSKNKRIKGEVSATSEFEARNKLREKGCVPYSLILINSSQSKKETKLEFDISSFFKIKNNVSDSDLAVFTKQLSTMVDAGVAIVQALDILAGQSTNPTLRDALIGVRQNVETGSDLATALERYPHVFSNLYISLVRAGASAGQLDSMLKKLSIYIEKNSKLKKQLISALTYPAIVIVLAFGMTIAMLLFVVPMFAKQYEDSGKALPGLTQTVIDMSNNLVAYWKEGFVIIVVATLMFLKWKKTPNGKLIWDQILLKLPIFGNVIQKISIARFASTMATLTSSGIAVTEGLQTCATASGNIIIEKEIYKIKEDVMKGKGIANPMEKSIWFPKLCTSMIAIGEQTGRLDHMLDKVASFYEDDVDAAISAALKMIEPFMFIVIGGIVGFILIAMYLPVFDLASTIG